MTTPDERVLPESRQAVPGSPEPATPGRPIRSPAQIERDIEARRERLAGTITAIADRVSPKNVAQRKVQQVKDVVTRDDGSLRPELFGAVAGAVVVVVVLVVLARRRGS